MEEVERLNTSEVKEDDNETETAKSCDGQNVQECPKKKRKKKKKKNSGKHAANQHRSSEDNADVDEVERSLREVNSLLGETPQIVTESRKAQHHQKSILNIQHKHLNPNNELKRIFGSKVIQAEQVCVPMNSEKHQAHKNESKDLFSKVNQITHKELRAQLEKKSWQIHLKKLPNLTSEVKEDDNETETAKSCDGQNVQECPKKKRKKKKKKNSGKHAANQHRSSEDNADVDEVERSLREVNSLLGETPQIVTESRKAQHHQKSILNIQHKHLNPNNELKRIFGSKVIQAEQVCVPMNSEKHQAHKNESKDLFSKVNQITLRGRVGAGLEHT
ncbi:hypothetical protein HUJ05_008720 [Dendroctonus ponderosae]|nr:hypothetical protein HUJ05_008720 [Dendroctonus ponderosae]